MSLRDNKKEILTIIGSYVSLIERINDTETTDLFPSINNKDDIVPYLLDMLKVVIGTEAIKELTGEFLGDFIGDVEPTIKTALKKQFIQANAGQGIQSQFLSTGAGYNIPVKNLDTFKKLKVDPNSDIGDLLYNKTIDNFDSSAYDAILNDGTNITFNTLSMNYNAATDNINFKTTASGNIGEWVDDYITNTTIINEKEVMSNMMDSIFGTLSSDQEKTENEIYTELQVKKLIEQLTTGDDSFVISQNDLDLLLEKANELKDGVTYNDLGCGLLEASLSLSGLTDYVSNISGATDANLIIDNTENVLNDTFLNPDNDQESNRSTIEDNFFQKLIQIIIQLIINSALTSPEIRSFMGVTSAFINNGNPRITSAVDDLSEYKTLSKCIIKELQAKINEFIFEKIKNYLIELTVPIVKKIIQEKVNQYVGSLKSLVTI